MTRLLLNGSYRVSDEVEVDGDELHYLTRVRRKSHGDTVEVQVSEGHRFRCRITHISRDQATLTVEEELPGAASSWPVNLLVAVPKRNLMDDIVRKVSEIGVEQILPVLTERSVARPGSTRVARWQRIAAESVRQCGRETPLAVEEIRPLNEALARLKGQGTTVILHPVGRAEADGSSLFDTTSPKPPISIAIGPEGGFTDAEIGMAHKLGFKQATLGAVVMRVETAAIAASVLAVAVLGGYSSAFAREGVAKRPIQKKS